MAASVGAALGLLASCGSDDDDLSRDGTPTTAEVTVEPSDPPNPILSGDGIEVTLEGSREAGWPEVERTCRADGYVNVRDGGVVGVEGGPDSFRPDVGETVYKDDGTVFDEEILVTEPAYRDDDGKLIVSWRECENQPAEGLACEDDGYVWKVGGIVVDVVDQPDGKPVEEGETVYGPDGAPLQASVYELVPVFRNEEGQLEFGWRSCEDTSAG
jgi:hypothetical protein